MDIHRIDFQIIPEPFDVQDFIEPYLHELVVALYEDAFRRRFSSCPCLGHFRCLFGSLQEFRIGNGFEQIVDGVDLVSFDGISFKSCREDYPGLRIYHPGQVQPAQFWHLDIEEEQLRGCGFQPFQGIDCV